MGEVIDQVMGLVLMRIIFPLLDLCLLLQLAEIMVTDPISSWSSH